MNRIAELELEFETVNKAQLLYETGRYQLAFDSLAVLQNNPSPIVLNQYCSIFVNCCLSLNNIQEAFDFTIAHLQDNPNNPTLFYLLSQIHIQKGEDKNALKAILKAVELNPEEGQWHSGAALIYFKQGNIDRVNYHLTIAESKDPESELNIYLRALLFMLKDDNKSAEESIKRGLILYPESSMMQNLFTGLDKKHRPSASALKELSLNALEADPFDEHAKESLLFSIKNSNPIVRFFVANGFSRYKIKWTPWRVILAILFWKGTFIWGGFGLLYLLITWAGTAIFFTIIRRHDKYKLIVPEEGIFMSNTFLILLSCSIIGTFIVYNIDSSPESLFGSIAVSLFLILTSISFFEIKSKNGKISFAIFMTLSILLLISSSGIMMLCGFLSIILLLIYAFLFTLNISFK